jgi:hypothetical protein
MICEPSGENTTDRIGLAWPSVCVFRIVLAFELTKAFFDLLMTVVSPCTMRLGRRLSRPKTLQKARNTDVTFHRANDQCCSLSWSQPIFLTRTDWPSDPKGACEPLEEHSLAFLEFSPPSK